MLPRKPRFGEVTLLAQVSDGAGFNLSSLPLKQYTLDGQNWSVVKWRVLFPFKGAAPDQL